MWPSMLGLGEHHRLGESSKGRPHICATAWRSSWAGEREISSWFYLGLWELSNAGCKKRGWGVWLWPSFPWGGDHQLSQRSLNTSLLHNFLQGLLGKLQIRRSGACQLLLGEDQVGSFNGIPILDMLNFHFRWWMLLWEPGLVFFKMQSALTWVREAVEPP